VDTGKEREESGKMLSHEEVELPSHPLPCYVWGPPISDRNPS
jgi:hypothetical protein